MGFLELLLCVLGASALAQAFRLWRFADAESVVETFGSFRWEIFGITTAIIGGIAVNTLAGGRPVFGLGGLLLYFFGVRSISRWKNRRFERSLERSSLSFFYALRGLLAAGVALPAALFRLASPGGSPFARAVAQSLERYDRGRSLSWCLARLRRGAGLQKTGLILDLLSLSYERGLPLLPLLDSLLPAFEKELQAAEKVRDLSRSAYSQIALAAAIPWGLGAFLAAMGESLECPSWLLGLTLLWKGMGILWLKRSVQFY